MREMTTISMTQANGGASKYVTCPICGYRSKTTILERLFSKDKVIKGQLQATHGLLRNINRGYAYSRSQKVHK